MGMNPIGKKRGAVAEINVTPLVDVMLVLLVIFMISTPLMAPQNQMKLVEMNLPKTTNNPTPMPSDAKKLILSISPKLEVFVGEEKITDCSAALAAPGPATYEPCFDEVERKLAQNAKLQEDKTLYLMADADIRYGFVVGVMNRIRKAGVTNFGMVTNPGYGADEAAAPTAKKPGQK